MKDRTIGHLWARYLQIRGELGESFGNEARRDSEREAAQLRDRLVVNYSPLVKYSASRVGARVPGVLDQEDIISWGILGLLDAVETYDPERAGKKVKFESYAISKIRWSILDHLRSQDWVPRRIRACAGGGDRCGSPEPGAKAPPDRGGDSRGSGHRGRGVPELPRPRLPCHVVSLEANDRAGVEYGELIKDPATLDPQSQADAGDLRAQRIAAIDELDEGERLVATFYFYEELTLKEIGRALNLTEGRVNQITRRALTKLHEHLKGSPLAHGYGQHNAG